MHYPFEPAVCFAICPSSGSGEESPAHWSIRPADEEHIETLADWMADQQSRTGADTEALRSQIYQQLLLAFRESALAEWPKSFAGYRNEAPLFLLSVYESAHPGKFKGSGKHPKEYNITLTINPTLENFDELWLPAWQQTLLYFFATPGLGRIVTEAGEKDLPQQAALAKLGFREQGRLFGDLFSYSCTRKE